MNILKRISLILVLVMIICFGCVGKSYAAISCNISLAGSGTVTEGKQVIVQVKISNIKSSIGMVALGATLDYDKTKLNYVGMNAGSGTWSKPSYNANNGKLVVDSDGEKSDGTVFEIVFEAKKGVTGDASITLKNISVGEINEEIKVANATKKVTIQAENTGNPGGNDNPGGNTGNEENNNNNNQGGSNNGTSNNGSSNNAGNSNNGGSSNKGGSSTNNKVNKPTTGTNNTQNTTQPEEPETPEENTDLEPREEDNEIENVDTNRNTDENYEDVKLVEGKKTNPIWIFMLIAVATILVVIVIIVVCKAKAKDKRTKKIGKGM